MQNKSPATCFSVFNVYEHTHVKQKYKTDFADLTTQNTVN